MFEYQIVKKYKKARTGIFNTLHGKLETPELAFVATEGEIKAIPKDILPQLPIKYMIVNTFHIWVKHILEKIESVNGIHSFSNYQNIIASDSGGFQVFSMGFGKSHQVGKIGGMFPGNEHESSDDNNPLTITEEGVKFNFNEQMILLTPEKSMEIQQKIGADIMFAFDECTSPLNSKEYTKMAMERTHRWIHRFISSHASSTYEVDQAELKIPQVPQALFAIVQGGYFQDLRKLSAQYMGKLDVPGFGIGGSLGTTEDEVRSVLDWTIPYLPDEKPRHLLGIGKVKDLFDGVERGVDLFDCVIPTREARHKVLYTKNGRLAIRKFRQLDEIFEKDCSCLACKEKITWKQLNQFFTEHDPKAFMYATVHNIQFYADLMKELRSAVELNKVSEIKEKYSAFY